jgi:hypothetical protein
MTPVAQAIMLRLWAGCLAPHSSPSLSLLYLSLGVYGAAVASGVAQEKTTRVAEVLLATVLARSRMRGTRTAPSPTSRWCASC